VVTGAVHGGEVRRLFDGLVPAEVIDAYDRLLASGGCAKDQAEALAGDAGLVRALTGCGMAHIQPHTPADPAWLRPAAPDLALLGCWPGTSTGSPATSNSCSTATTGSPAPKPGSAPP